MALIQDLPLNFIGGNGLLVGDFIKSGQMKNRFEKYLKYQKENGKIVDVNVDSFILADEAFLLFKTLYDTDYGSIEENDNLISIHTGGWSENEEIIREFEETAWWFMYHKITARGGHYYFNTDFHSDKNWKIIVK